jgi:hypothetical protein
MSSPDHRNTNRVRSFLRGEIMHSNGSSKTECTVRDISDGGARIEAPVSVTVPEHFELAIPQRNIRHRARMIWRHGTELGVAFQAVAEKPAAQPPRPEDHNAELRLRMLELEAETARLRTQLADMRAALDGMMRERKTA